MRSIQWTQQAWADYLYWHSHHKTMADRVNLLIKDIRKHPTKGIGAPIALKYPFEGVWSRHITMQERLCYRVANDRIILLMCRLESD